MVFAVYFLREIERKVLHALAELVAVVIGGCGLVQLCADVALRIEDLYFEQEVIPDILEIGGKNAKRFFDDPKGFKAFRIIFQAFAQSGKLIGSLTDSLLQ